MNCLLTIAMALCLFGFVEAVYNKTEFKAIVYNDRTNDDAINMNAQELLKRSGYDYEEYDVIADDGYITQIVRIVNPLAERSLLKKPPVLLYHGGNIDMTCYLIASSIQHHPEKYPRVAEDGPITSSNRSLAFTLANYGYDVWLIGTRGSNVANQRHIKDTDKFHYSKTEHYWQYGLDDIVFHEIKNQIDKVREITDSKEYSLYSFSLSTPTTLAFLGLHPEYAKDVRVYFQMGPSVIASFFEHSFDKVYFQYLCPLFPTRGTGFTPTYFATPLIGKLALFTAKSSLLRYTTIYKKILIIAGPSPKYQTNLELNLLAHVFQPVSFKSVQQFCQFSKTKKMLLFDYGHSKNEKIYGQEEPPQYDIRHIEVQNYYMISGNNDALATPESVENILKQVSTPTPIQQIVAPNFNHFDLIGAVENDKYINLPVVEVLNRFSTS